LSAAPDLDRPNHDVYLVLGSNIRPERFIPLAVEELARRFPITEISSVWQTPAEGFVGADFLNAVVKIRTHLTPLSLKFRVLRPLEAQLGRVRTEHKFSPRTIDIDILIHSEEILDQEIWRQPHIAIPLAELLPDLAHPESGARLDVISKNLLTGATISQRTEIQLEISS
jgi:2-amino-4-hydroxy-6-hydroxymethyldihydropteridine diphosphokinase